jgi:hypothetical protein
VIEECPHNAFAHFFRAEAAREQADRPTAFRHIQLAEKYGLERVCVVRLLSELHTDAREWVESERLLKEWCELEPDYSYPIRYRGMVLRIMGNDEVADQAAEQASKLGQTSLMHELLWQCRVVWEFDTPEHAEQLFTRILGRSGWTTSDYAWALAVRGQRRLSAGRAEEGYADLTEASRLMPWEPEYRRIRAQAAISHWRETDAAEDAAAYHRLKGYDPKATRLWTYVRDTARRHATVAGVTPEFRPVGPVERVPINISAYQTLVDLVNESR